MRNPNNYSFFSTITLILSRFIFRSLILSNRLYWILQFSLLSSSLTLSFYPTEYIQFFHRFSLRGRDVVNLLSILSPLPKFQWSKNDKRMQFTKNISTIRINLSNISFYLFFLFPYPFVIVIVCWFLFFCPYSFFLFDFITFCCIWSGFILILFLFCLFPLDFTHSVGIVVKS